VLAGAGPIHAATNFMMEKLGRQAVTRWSCMGESCCRNGARMRQRTERALAIERLLCDGDAGFDSGAGGSSGHGGAGGTDKRSLPADDGLSLTSVVGRPFVEGVLEAATGWG